MTDKERENELLAIIVSEMNVMVNKKEITNEVLNEILRRLKKN